MLSFVWKYRRKVAVYQRHVQVDDAVGATCVHGFGGMWGMIAIGLFAQKDEMTDVGYSMYVRL